MEREIVLDVQGETVVAKAPDSLEGSTERIAEILVLISDPEQSLAEINKRIAIEIAYVSMAMAEATLDVTKQHRIRSLTEQVKALRELAKTLNEAEQISKRDVLNFDGPKFIFVLGKLVEMFKKAMTTSGKTEAEANDVIRKFRDILSVYEPHLRRETERVGFDKN